MCAVLAAGAFLAASAAAGAAAGAASPTLLRTENTSKTEGWSSRLACALERAVLMFKCGRGAPAGGVELNLQMTFGQSRRRVTLSFLSSV